MATTLSGAMPGLVGLLAEPTRLRIVAALQGGPATSAELAEALDVPPAVVAEPLEVLRSGGVVVRGRHERFRLADQSIAVACAALRGVLRRRLARLETLADLTLEGRPAR